MMARMLICAVILFVVVDCVSGQTNRFSPSTRGANAEIEEILDQERDMVFNDATLREFVAYLIASGIPTYIDARSLDDYGIGVDTTINFEQPAIRLRDGLDLILHEIDLSWTIRSGRLVITTPEEEENSRMIRRVYDVRNLVELVPIPFWGDGSGFGAPSIAYQYDFDSLIHTITSAVEPDSWAHVGGPGDIQPYYTRRMRVIVISQTYEIHRQVQALLSELAEHGGLTPLRSAPAYSVPSQQPGTLVRSPTSHSFPRSVGIRTSRLRTSGQ